MRPLTPCPACHQPHDAARLTPPRLPADGSRCACCSRERCPTIRFWILAGDSFARVSLRPGQSLTRHTGGPTDEGYHHETTTYHYETVNEDGRPHPRVVMNWRTMARDCDGRFDDGGESWIGPEHASTGYAFHPPTEGHADPSRPVTCPDWQHGDHWQRDYAAEAAGY